MGEAPRTNVWPSPAAACQVKSWYGLGGAILPSRAPVRVAPNSASWPGIVDTATKYGGTLASAREALAGPAPAGCRMITPETARDATTTPATAAAAATGASRPG